MDNADRITELEIKLAHCEHHIEELNRTAFRQQKQLDLLQDQLRELYRMVQSEAGSTPQNARDEIPPHY